jgi:PhzF family phenazine biosynthesis protein
MDVSVEIVNAFVDGSEGGNPAGVVLDAEGLDSSQKLATAARLGLSETAFVSPSPIAAFKLEFFTPTRQIAHCGHATIATFCCLRQRGRVGDGESSKETIDGTRRIHLDGDMAFMEQTGPRYTQVEGRHAALAALHLTADDLLPGFDPVVVNTGNSFLLVPLRDAAAVRKVEPALAAITAVSEELDLIGYYVFSPETVVPGRDAGARMFAPRYGITEESATGMAAGPLACFLHDRMGVRKDRVQIEQGRLMSPPSPSVIQVRLFLSGGGIRSVMAGGRGKVLRSLVVRV